ncbi:MAG: Spy/CpxP family protein refolding chaperone [Methylovirgula sp.]
MHNRIAKSLAAAIVVGLALAISFLPGVTQEAFALRRGGGGHFGGHAHFGGGHFGGRHFGGRHFGHMRARHFGRAHFRRHFAHRHFGGGARAGHRLGATARLAGFHGIHGTDPHGFNRNAFGGMRGWSHWARNNWGVGWNEWGSGWGYWAGPAFWPFFYGDVLTFAFWPGDLYDPFFAYGLDYLLSAIFWPGPLFGPYGYGDYPLFDVYGYPPDAENYYGYHRYRHHRSRAAANSTPSTGETCGGLAPGVTDLPIDQIKKAIKPTDQQMDMLNQLQAASTKAAAILRASCPSEVPLTPVGRLDAVAKRLHAMIQAVDMVRAPLTTLDKSLDDQQRERLAALGGRSKYRHAAVAMSEAPARDLAALCKKQTAGFTLLPVQRIEDMVKPTEQQKSAFDALKSASTTAAGNLDASCPSEMPETMTDRLDTVVKRLNALIDAVDIVKPALTRFYQTLSDEQKARFNVIGGANNAAAPQDKGQSGE